MIYYGYVAHEFIPEDLLEEIEEAERSGVEHITCYSVSNYAPPHSILGVELFQGSSLFFPVDVSRVCFTPTAEEVAKVKAVFESLSDELKACFTQEPGVYIFETSDD
jgi:hypothetical protein